MKILRKAKYLYRTHSLDKHFKKELSNIKSKSAISSETLSYKQKKELSAYYGQFGLKVDCRWHEYLYAVTGEFNVKNIPENLYHCCIEPLFTRGSEDFEDKAYMERLLPNVKMPENYFQRMNGYYYDGKGRMISENEMLKNLSKLDEKVIIKPSVLTGGGRAVSLISGQNVDHRLLELYGKDFLIQRRILQHPQYSRFNESSVNTEKIISFLYKGDVYILTSILRIGAPGACTDTASGGRGYTIGIKENGQLNDVGFNILGEKFHKDAAGKSFSSIQLESHQDICEIIKQAHAMLPKFGIISWDFAVDVDREPILIEYNLNYPDVLIYQMNNGPLFGNLTDEILDSIKRG